MGLGFDIHRLRAGRPLVLGGVRLEWPRGLAGHSDGDCLLHALTDALLGAAGAGDIGDLFPDTDPQWKDAPSDMFVEGALTRVRARGLSPRQVDATVLAEEPRLGPRKREIAEHIAHLLGLPASAVSVKAKTLEGLGSVGAGEAIAAQVLVVPRAPTRPTSPGSSLTFHTRPPVAQRRRRSLEGAPERQLTVGPGYQ
jgi:2-C-methyl-D-erythritol 2,4-cyclodiphosphate synthase